MMLKRFGQIARCLVALGCIGPTLIASLQHPAWSQLPGPSYIALFAGGGNGDGGPATQAIVDPRGLTTHIVGLYIADGKGNRIRRVDSVTGLISTVAGTGASGYGGDGGLAINAKIGSPLDVTFDSRGNMYLSEQYDHRIRRIDPTGVITTVAGNGVSFDGGDNGPAIQAGLSTPYGIAVDGTGNLYIADFDNHRVRRVDPYGIITTVAGTGVNGYSGDGGAATAAQLGTPSDVSVDANGNLYIVDCIQHVVRQVDSRGIITTVAGNGFAGFAGDGGSALQAQLYLPFRVAIDAAGDLFITDMGNNRVRRVDARTGIITTVAGTGTMATSGDGGPGTAGSLYRPSGVAIDASNNLYIGTSVNSSAYWSYDNRVRVLNAAGVINTAVGLRNNGDGAAAFNAIIDPYGLSAGPSTSPDLYIADKRNNQVRKVSAATGLTSTVAGTGAPGFSGDGGLATAAALWAPADVMADTAGNVWIADTYNSRVRRVDSRGYITTFAGNGRTAYSGDGGDALSASLYYPQGIAMDAGGNLYIADTINYRIRKVTPQRIISTVAGNGTWGSSGDGGPATEAQLGSPTDVAVGSDGSIYIEENGTHRIRKVSPSGTITTIAGTGNSGFGGDGGLAIYAALNSPFRLALDVNNNLFISDSGNLRVRRIDALSAIITTVAGSGIAGTEGDGGPGTQANLYAATGITVDANGYLYISQANSARVRVLSLLPPPPAGSMGIAGLIHYYSNPSLAVSGAMVQLRNMTAGTITATAPTNAVGQFAFSGLSGGSWQVQPLKSGDAGSAIDIQDAVAIMQSTVGTRTLSAQQHIACDVSGDNSVNISDAVLILQYTVGLISRFPVAQTCNSDWAFVPEPVPAANQQILAPLISTTTCRNGAIGFNPLAAQANNQNFSAVLFGDCIGNWRPSGSGAAAALVAADTANGVRIGQPVQNSGGRFHLPVSVTAGSFRGLTAELRYDPTQFTAFRVRPVRRARSALMQANLQVPGLVKVALVSGRPLPKGAAFVLELESKQGQAGTPQVRIQRTVIAR